MGGVGTIGTSYDAITSNYQLPNSLPKLPLPFPLLVNTTPLVASPPHPLSDLFGVAGDHAAADGRNVGEAAIGTPACRVEATEVEAARAAVAGGEAAWGVVFTKRGEGSGDLGREFGNW